MSPGVYSRSIHGLDNGKGVNGTEQIPKPNYGGETASNESEVTSTTQLEDIIGYHVHPRSMKFLKPRKWLNDEIIDFLTELVEIYSRGTHVKAKSLGTIFMNKLLQNGYNYEAIEREMTKSCGKLRCNTVSHKR